MWRVFLVAGLVIVSGKGQKKTIKILRYRIILKLGKAQLKTFNTVYSHVEVRGNTPISQKYGGE